MDVFEAIRGRRSIRSYLNKPVEFKKIVRCLEAARWAPSAVNSQPWEFIVITDKNTREKLAEIHRWGRFLKESPVAICVLTNPRRSPNYYHGDAAAATQNLLLAAYAQGLGTCWIGVLNSSFEEPIKKLLNVPDHLRVLCLVAMGYPAEHPTKDRIDLSEIVHWEKYGIKKKIDVSGIFEED